ncbi:MAG: hypothetical protein JJU45_08155 [Acidimicrobiia bacterium]|nr:hypothetical protein [Acidimicrobiia bacterium]
MTAIVALLQSAEDVAIVASFLIASDEVQAAIVAAAARGVRVYLMTASEQRLDRGHRGWSATEEERSREHQFLLDELAGNVLVRTAPGFHAKVVIVDPMTNPQGLLLTSNLVYVDLEANLEVGVALEPDEVRSMYRVLRWAFWEAAEHELLEPQRLQSVRAADLVEWERPQEPVVSSNRHQDGIGSTAVQAIRDAQVILASNFGWAADHPVVRELCAAARAGKHVTILARCSKRAKRASPALLELARSGAAVLGHHRLHAKLLQVDLERCLVHSANHVSIEDESNLELGIWTDGARAEALAKILDDWVASAPWRLVAEAQLRDVGSHLIDVSAEGWKEVVVQERIEVVVPPLVAHTALDLDISPDTSTLDPSNHEPARTVEFRWTVAAPRLKRKAREVFREDVVGGRGRTSFEPKVFDERRGRRVVAVSSEAELGAARALVPKVGAQAVVVQQLSKSAQREKQ